MKNFRRSVAVSLSVFALDNLCISVVLPIFTILLLQSHPNISHLGATLSERYLDLGWLIAAFPIGMVLGALLIGYVADSRGRKAAFVTTLVGEIFGTLCTIVGFFEKNYYFLLLGRAISGFFAGNITLCLATMADVSPPGEKRAAHFGLLGVVGGLTFVAGILLGGLLSNQTLNLYFTPTLVFSVILLLTLINIVLISLFYDETYEKHPILHSPFELRHIFKYYFVYFFAIIGWFILIQFLNADIYVRFGGTKMEMTWMLVASGIIFSLGTGLFRKRLSSVCSSHHLVWVPLLVTTICLAAAGAVSSFLNFAIFYFIAVVGISFVWIGLLSFISSKASKCSQGTIVSANQGILAICMAIAPAMGGYIANLFTIRGVYYSGAVFTAIAFILYLIFVNRKSINLS